MSTIQFRCKERGAIKRPQIYAFAGAHDGGPECQYENTIADPNFKSGVPILVRNAGAESELGPKTKPKYFGPMAVIRRSRSATYPRIHRWSCFFALRFVSTSSVSVSLTYFYTSYATS